MTAARSQQQNSSPQKKNTQTRTGKTFDLQPELSSGMETIPGISE